MEVQMCSFTVLSIILFFVGDVWTGTLQYKDVSPRRCHHCIQNATINCQTLTEPPVLCPAGQPYCATAASAPNFTSSLTCAAARDTPCSLKINSKLELEMTCICTDQLCNMPFSIQLRNDLLNFSTNIPVNITSFTELFFESSIFANVSKTELYKMINEFGEASERPTTFMSQSTINGLISIDISETAPRAEALKHEATVPPDDDEDDGEGSGTLEETKTQAAPAAPSSYLPAEENRASLLNLNFYLFMTTMFYVPEIL